MLTVCLNPFETRSIPESEARLVASESQYSSLYALVALRLQACTQLCLASTLLFETGFVIRMELFHQVYVIVWQTLGIYLSLPSFVGIVISYTITCLFNFKFTYFICMYLCVYTTCMLNLQRSEEDGRSLWTGSFEPPNVAAEN